MIFEVPFIKEIYLNQTKLQFDYVWKSNLKKSWKGLVFSIIYLATGLFFIGHRSFFGVIIFSIGTIYLYKFYEFWHSYKNNKKRYFSESEKHVTNFIEIKSKSIWEFKDDFFKYSDEKCEVKMDWSFFKNFDIVEENIFLNTSHVNISYILGKDEISESDFNKLVSFLSTKLERLDVSS
ncbi:hypothetical protein [Winogradskyella haliclonae]|uniref:YcxB-like protein domain-containing protein n=1 Tax=Winogradskyella haliclonae TaxID=2048558 RepID=A0ABQ2BXU3_9FLAO|nr:hypothetical protein [Winogradskyella haliclonae]GGI57311.1 hypothetical protein GCM10011444_16200 [Winogradskyella haliclonae]